MSEKLLRIGGAAIRPIGLYLDDRIFSRDGAWAGAGGWGSQLPTGGGPEGVQSFLKFNDYITNLNNFTSESFNFISSSGSHVM